MSSFALFSCAVAVLSVVSASSSGLAHAQAASCAISPCTNAVGPAHSGPNMHISYPARPASLVCVCPASHSFVSSLAVSPPVVPVVRASFRVASGWFWAACLAGSFSFLVFASPLPTGLCVSGHIGVRVAACFLATVTRSHSSGTYTSLGARPLCGKSALH